MWWLALALLYLLLVNQQTYALFAEDKFRAVHGYWRVPESRMLLMAALGGSLGAVVAQRRLRHKVNKQPFAGRLLMIAGLQGGLTLGAAGVAATSLIGT